MLVNLFLLLTFKVFDISTIKDINVITYTSLDLCVLRFYMLNFYKLSLIYHPLFVFEKFKHTAS